jgi:hypothetical protein
MGGVLIEAAINPIGASSANSLPSSACRLPHKKVTFCREIDVVRRSEIWDA